ncbi:hypothetical protein HPB47_008989 [Ixodes persulcatus]|uniref:Uncharacterized protein n=1 Tax=Ixodes persulcatus TaxID=34615 RepID=A0AC60P3H0_IXOPE|nr:hypothetical protein HPB47_008989 [Ixodes persulcatus]
MAQMEAEVSYIGMCLRHKYVDPTRFGHLASMQVGWHRKKRILNDYRDGTRDQLRTGLRPVLVMESTTALLSLYASLCHHEETSQELSLKLSLLTDQLCVLVNDDSNPELALRAAGSLCATLAIPGLLTATNLDLIRSTLVRVATQDAAPPVGAEHGDLLAAAVRLNLPLADGVLSLLKEEICRDNRALYQKLLAKYLLDVVCRAEKCGTTVHHAALLRSVVAAWIESLGSEQGTAATEDFVEASLLVQKLAQMCSASHLAGKCLAGLVNKLTDGDVEKVLQCLQSSWQPQWTLAKADLLLWVTKGLLLRGYPDLAKYTNLVLPILVDALSSAEVLVVGQCVLPCLTENVALMVSCLNSVVEQLLRLAKPPQPMV